MTRAELKTRAKQKLAGNWGWAVGISAILLVINIIFGFSISKDVVSGTYQILTETGTDRSVISGTYHISLSTRALQFVVSILAASISLGFLHLVDNRRDSDSFSAAFAGFREQRVGSFLLTWLLKWVFTSLWTLLFVIPGIIKSYSYAMSFYIVDDLKRQGKDISATEAITKSRRLMDGHKFDLFVLDLSFLGWSILCLFTAGIGYLWLAPYVQTTRSEFYRALVSQNPSALLD
ncbi:DUF975 family protein [Streptococcus dentiloxodontae]